MTRLLVCGAINWDTTCLVDHLPVPGEEVTCDSVSEVPGGTGANVAVAAARLLGRDEVALFGALGRDDIAEAQLSVLEAEGVAHEYIARMQGQPSGHAYIFVDYAGQNVIATALGANAALARDHIRKSRLSTLLEGCRCVAVTDPPLPVASYILRAAVDLGLAALWDPGVLVRHGWNALAPVSRGIDSLVLNEAEASQLLGTAEPAELRTALAEGPDYVVLKRGERGAHVISIREESRTLHVPPLPLAELGMSPNNAVGCGDVFLGAYAACLSEDVSRQESLLVASAASGYNVTRPETRGGPDRTTLDGLMRRIRDFGFTSDRLEHHSE